MEKSESIVKLTVALIKAQGELETVEKDTKAYNYMYATLPAVFEEYKKHFLKHGLVIIQAVEGHGLRTTLAHESGEWVSSVADLMPIKNDPQAQGSAITYMRRYALGAMCGIQTEVDDDGAKAMPTEHKSDGVPSHPYRPSTPGPVDGVPNSAKNAIGIPTDYVVRGDFHEWSIDGVKLSTKTEQYVREMTEAYKGKEKVSVSYTEVIKGRYKNNYIAKVDSVIEEMPF